MKPLGRNYSILGLIKKSPNLMSMLYRSVLIFSDPISLWKAYIKGKKPAGNFYKLRNGLKLYLSDNEHDSITVMVIFCRREYGKINKNESVIDIGANIGIFTMYAIWSGAKEVVSVEPNFDSFQTLLANINNNKVNDKVTCINNAIGPVLGEKVFIPRGSSPYNVTKASVSSEDKYEEVSTITLEAIISDKIEKEVDLLKMDCEGAEYPVIYGLQSEIFNRIRKVRLEHHNKSEKVNLINHFSKFGFKLLQDHYMIMWFAK